MSIDEQKGELMKIAMLVDDFHPNVGGTPTYAKELAKALHDLEMEPEIITHRYPGYEQDASLNSVLVRRLPGFVLRKFNVTISPNAIWTLKRLLNKYDIVHGLDLYSPISLCGVYLAHRGKMPTVMTNPALHTYTGILKLVYQPVKYVLKKADHIIAVSEAAKGFIKSFGLEDSKISVIYHGVDSEKFRNIDTCNIRKELGTGPSPLIMTVTRLINRKGLNYLIEAMPHVLQEYKDVKLVIVGWGPERNRLERIAKDLKIKDSVIFAGAVGDETLLKIYAAADIFVLPSPHYEAFGIVLLEAMAAGLPVITTRTGGMPEFIINFHNGILVEPKSERQIGEAILRLLNDKKLAQRLARNGLKLVRTKYTWETAARRTIDIYKKVKLKT